jgi:hypothetical protein
LSDRQKTSCMCWYCRDVTIIACAFGIFKEDFHAYLSWPSLR